jgi:hypothetical protein
MTIFQLEDALVEFVIQNTSELRYVSNNESGTDIDSMIAPRVWAGYIPRNSVGAILPGEITTYPAIILSAKRGVQPLHDGWNSEMVDVEMVIGLYDPLAVEGADVVQDQQGYRDIQNLVQRLKDRFREVSIIRERFPIRMPLKWEINRFFGGEATTYFPYYFGDMLLTFELPVMTSQYDVDKMTADTTPGRYNSGLPISPPVINPLQEEALRKFVEEP